MHSMLGAVTKPWKSIIEREHSPKRRRGRRGYRKFVPCLRWEFGFFCSVCLLHERDFKIHGTVGSGMMTVEHIIPVSEDPSKVNDYGNCLYVCRFCNTSRGALSGEHLLSPDKHEWARAFWLVSDKLIPREGEQGDSALRTIGAYDLNDPRKVVMRLDRRELITDKRELVENMPGLEQELTDRAAKTGDPVYLEGASKLRRAYTLAIRDLLRLLLIPEDVSECSCEKLCSGRCQCGSEGATCLKACFLEDCWVENENLGGV